MPELSTTDLIDLVVAAVKLSPDHGVIKVGGRKYSYTVSHGVAHVYAGRTRLVLTLYL